MSVLYFVGLQSLHFVQGHREFPVLKLKNSPDKLIGGLGATYTVHLRLMWKLVVDLLFVLIELFSLGVTTEALRANIFIRNRLFWMGLVSFGQIFKY